MKRPTLGQLCKISGETFKTREPLNKNHRYPFRTSWERYTPGPLMRNKTIHGIYIGYRQVKEGTTEREYDYGYESEFIQFRAERTHEVWLIVTDERHNPIYCFPDQVEFSEPST